MPHARPTGKKIERGDFVIIDWCGESNGYFSDMTRTLLLEGPVLSQKKRMYNIVNVARKAAISAVQNRVGARVIDRAARDVIDESGYGEYFGHGTGHGVGLDVHEAPRISKSSAERIYNGMVFTIEPGIYIPDIGGVRIEDMVALNRGKVSVLTKLGRELEVVK
jgi:Xaa-Pro aminopeptidase